MCGLCSQLDKFFREVQKETQKYSIHFWSSLSLLSESDYAIVTWGTATLETALFKVPQVVHYKSSHISFAIAKKII